MIEHPLASVFLIPRKGSLVVMHDEPPARGIVIHHMMWFDAGQAVERFTYGVWWDDIGRIDVANMHHSKISIEAW